MPIGAIGAAAASAGLNAVGNIVSNLFGQKMSYKNNVRLMDRAQQYSRENADYANQMAIANWQMENNYNTPANQIQRLMDAGLNPNLIYGNGTASAGNAGSVAKPAMPDTPNAPYQDYGNLGIQNLGTDAVRAYQQAQSIDIQNELAKSQVDYQNAMRQNVLQDTINKQTQNAGNLLNNEKSLWRFNVDKEMVDVYKGTLRAQLAQINRNIDKMSSDMDVNAARIGEINANTALLGARLNLTRDEASLLQARVNLIVRQTYTEMERERGLFQSNNFSETTFNDRADLISESLTNALIRNDRGRIGIDIDRANLTYRQLLNVSEIDDQRGRKLFGIGRNTSLKNIPSVIINRVIGDLNR